jgi:proline iminopeptidase
VRDGWHNMKYYKNINKDVMVQDFERVREYLGIDKWLVWGGSWGSTMGILYAEMFPSRCISLILRGIYLDTKAENIGLYSQSTYEGNPKRMKDFGIFFDYAKERNSLLDPYDAHAIMSTYGDLIMSGDLLAIWQWYVFEHNLIEFDPEELLDPNHIDPEEFSTALSVAFFESRLWLHSSFEENPPKNLLTGDLIQKMDMPIWICQGTHDEVCPDKYAHLLVDAIEEAGAIEQLTARFVEATHEDSDPVMEQCLMTSMEEFVEYHDSQKPSSTNDGSIISEMFSLWLPC